MRQTGYEKLSVGKFGLRSRPRNGINNQAQKNFKIGATDFGVQTYKTPRFVIEMHEINGVTGFVLSKKSVVRQ
jgi:hypothetical protein